VWPVALTTALLALEPLLPSAIQGLTDRRYGRRSALWDVIRSDASVIGEAECESLSRRMQGASFLVPGTLIASALALALPVAPFQHGLVVGLATVATIVAWLPATFLAWIARRPVPAEVLAQTPRSWRTPTCVVAAVIAPLWVLLFVRGLVRPSPDGYWDSLVPVYDSSTSDGRARKSDPSCGRAPLGGRLFTTCAYETEDGLCVVVPSFDDICLTGYGEPSCPGIAVRRESAGGRSVVARWEVPPIYPPGPGKTVFGGTSAHLFAPQYDPFAGTNEGRELTALAVRDAVGVPHPWLGLSGAGLLAIALLRLRDRRVARLRAATRRDRPPYRSQESVGDRDETARDVLVWRAAALLLLASCGPTWISVALGVGR
jgi:hypothetical protein